MKRIMFSAALLLGLCSLNTAFAQDKVKVKDKENNTRHIEKNGVMIDKNDSVKVKSKRGVNKIKDQEANTVVKDKNGKTKFKDKDDDVKIKQKRNGTVKVKGSMDMADTSHMPGMHMGMGHRGDSTWRGRGNRPMRDSAWRSQHMNDSTWRGRRGNGYGRGRGDSTWRNRMSDSTKMNNGTMMNDSTGGR
jgi:hypothetical protein